MTDFDLAPDRRPTAAYKWQCDDDVLPLWVADMDFATAPCVAEAVQRRAAHPIYGYVSVPDTYYEATIEWFRRRHGFAMQREWIVYTSGVVPALSAILQAEAWSAGFQPAIRTAHTRGVAGWKPALHAEASVSQAESLPPQSALVLTPVYNCFYSSIRNSGYRLVASPLRYEDGTYHIDFDDFERRAADPSVSVFILCNPHNPAGRVWTKAELTRLGRICLRHGVFVISDEIHCEFVMPGHTYTPFASLSEAFLRHSATCTSPSKAFNTAGLQIANITIADPDVRAAVERQININEVCDVNPFGPVALVAAYSAEGAAWLDELLHYIYGNYEALRAFFAEHMPQYTVTRLEGTYLVWVDVHEPARAFCQRLLREGRVWLNEGEMYDPAGSTFVRVNIACPRARLLEALRRMSEMKVG